MAAGILGQHMRQIHHPARHPRQAAARDGIRHGLGHSHSTYASQNRHRNTSFATIAESRRQLKSAAGGVTARRPLAALALDDPVALLQQAFALAILAFLLLLDVRPFFIGHNILPRALQASP
jgi:hypothetical protein